MRLIALAIVVGAALIAGSNLTLYRMDAGLRLNTITGRVWQCDYRGCIRLPECHPNILKAGDTTPNPPKRLCDY